MNILPDCDHKTPVAPAEAFQAVLHRLGCSFRWQFDCYAAYLRGFPNIADRHVQEVVPVTWSKETLGMKPIVSITHFSAAWASISRIALRRVVVSKQVYATHYRNAAITMNVVVADGASHYLVYINRSQIDAFKGMFGGFVRRVVERRVLAEAPDVLRGIRAADRGDPARSTATDRSRYGRPERSPIRGRTSESLDYGCGFLLNARKFLVARRGVTREFSMPPATWAGRHATCLFLR